MKKNRRVIILNNALGNFKKNGQLNILKNSGSLKNKQKHFEECQN